MFLSGLVGPNFPTPPYFAFGGTLHRGLIDTYELFRVLLFILPLAALLVAAPILSRQAAPLTEGQLTPIVPTRYTRPLNETP